MDTSNSELIVSLLQSLMDSVTDGVLIVDLMGKIILYNHQFERMWNIPSDVLETKQDAAALNCILNQLEDPEGFYERVTEIYSHPQDESYDTIAFLDGRVFARYTRPQKMGDEIVGRVCSFCDVSHKHWADKARLLQEEKYRNIFDNAPVGIIQSTLEGKIIDANPALARIFGYESPEEMISVVNQASVVEAMYVNPLVRDDFAAKAAISPGRWLTGEALYRRKDSSIINGRIAFRIVPGEEVILEGFVEDITERELAEDKLRDSERFLRQIEKIARIGGWKVNPVIDSLSWTKGVYDIVEAPLDYKPSLEQGLEFYTPQYRPILKEAVTKALENNEPYKVEAEVITTSGKTLWTEVRGLMRVEDGSVPQVVGTFQDVTERKQIEAALEISETKYRLMFSESPVGMMYLDKDGNILEVNQKMLDILGSPEAEATKTINMLTFPPIIKSGLSQHYHDCLKCGKLVDAETQYTTKWGKQTYLRSVIKPHMDENGEIIGAFTVIEDVALRKQTEDALSESQSRYKKLFQSLKDLINMHSEIVQNASQTVESRTLPDVSKNLEMNYIENALRKTKGKIQPAAKLLGISRFTLMRQMAKMGINGDNYK
ncbi:MAG: PAS domain S-box protein [Pseudomonadota bacterium]